jgi:hypothetical protein
MTLLHGVSCIWPNVWCQSKGSLLNFISCKHTSVCFYDGNLQLQMWEVLVAQKVQNQVPRSLVALASSEHLSYIFSGP